MTCECGVIYKARQADIKRGWGKSCSKRCAAKRRNSEASKRYPIRVEMAQAYAFIGVLKDVCEIEGEDVPHIDSWLERNKDYKLPDLS